MIDFALGALFVLQVLGWLALIAGVALFVRTIP